MTLEKKYPLRQVEDLSLTYLAPALLGGWCASLFTYYEGESYAGNEE